MIIHKAKFKLQQHSANAMQFEYKEHAKVSLPSMFVPCVFTQVDVLVPALVLRVASFEQGDGPQPGQAHQPQCRESKVHGRGLSSRI